eukprot:TRINITY_DN47357_c0_g1_i1.p1 TRINITY_DN47357_c0_g1~~TRINITY_DN47357_c0_g1_i1.p1  ORF type:complete len:630 (+),score=114.31 TRINITY_DN47357_c0_g1_i1:85-1890(+)
MAAVREGNANDGAVFEHSPNLQSGDQWPTLLQGEGTPSASGRCQRKRNTQTGKPMYGSGFPGTGTGALLEELESPTTQTVDAVLCAVARHQGNYTASEAVQALHLIAKLYDANAIGPMPAVRDAVGTLGPSFLPHDQRFQTLVRTIRTEATELDGPRIFMQTLWALGKVASWSIDVQGIIDVMGEAAPQQLPLYSSQELSQVLWGLARLCGPEAGNRPQGHGAAYGPALRLAHAVVAEGAPRVELFTAQCLSNSLWAVAKLSLHGPQVESFAASCLEKLRKTNFVGIASQSLANSLWAAAKLRLSPAVTVPFCIDVAIAVTSQAWFLEDYQPQEISMMMWAFAKILGRGAPSGHGRQRDAQLSPQVVQFALKVAAEGVNRLHEFSPQGLSNMAWAFATMDLTQREAPQQFILRACDWSLHQLHQFPPQAIANFIWALARLDPEQSLAAPRRFAIASLEQALRRSDEFSWQDLSGIISAMMQAGLSNVDEVRHFVQSVVQRATHCCGSIGTQALLNIALSAKRLGVDRSVLTPFAWGIAQVFTWRAQQLNDIDLRQWREVQRHCQLPGAPPASADHHQNGRCGGGGRRRGGGHGQGQGRRGY